MPGSTASLRGTSQEEFYIGKGDIDTLGDPIVGLRTTAAGQAQYKEAGGVWTDFGSGGSFDENDILTGRVTGEVLVSRVTGNVLVKP